jgi:probable rRNA maturation factor
MITPMVAVHLNGTEHRELPIEVLRRAVLETLEGAGCREAEISITFLGDAGALELNHRYLNHDWVPDVLTFALHGPGDPPLGDIYIGFDQAIRQALGEGVSSDEEFIRLAVHGTLHVLGFDHPESAERHESAMYLRQEEIVRRVMSGHLRPSESETGPRTVPGT